MLFIKMEAIRFLYHFCDKLNYENLKHYIHNNTTIRVRAYSEDPELTDSLKPSETTDGFIHCGEEFTAIFIDESLSDAEKTEALLHEFCHFIKHSYTFSYLIKPRKREELEAENFVFYTLRYHKTVFYISNFLKKYAVAFLLAALLIYTNLSPGQSTSTETLVTVPEQMEVVEPIKTEPDNDVLMVEASTIQTDDTTVYVTPTGTRYHKADCQYVNPNTATELTIEEAQTDYLPCKRCKPNNS